MQYLQFSKNFPLPKNGGHFEFSNFCQKMAKHKFASISLTVRDRAISSKFSTHRVSEHCTLGNFLCQLTCQSADIMSSLCGVGVRVRVRVRVNNFFSKTTRPRDMLFFLKDTLSIEDEKLFKACKSVCSSVC